MMSQMNGNLQMLQMGDICMLVFCWMQSCRSIQG
jgi:hypothetical protein